MFFSMFRTMLSLILAAGLVPAPGVAEVRALLIGVGDYLVLDADLKGPPADVVLMAEVLAARGVDVAAMRILTSGGAFLTGGKAPGAPTRAGILGAMSEVAAESVAGDTVVFYFSGHGAQAPDASGDEGGGLDEILLPADARGWSGATQRVENALLDDELQVWAQGMLDRGVKVVGVIDACHSATGFRAVGGAGVARALPPQVLGIPEGAASGEMGGGEGAGLRGEFVFLYSSQSDQRSFEFPLGETGLWHGAFTLALAETLRTAPGANWQQVLTAVTAGMARGAVRQMPDGEGPMLDQAVFGEATGQARYAVTGARLAAGLLHGLTEGSEVAVYAQPAGGAAIGHARVAFVAAREAGLAGDIPPGARWAEVAASPPPPPLRVGVPVVRDEGNHAAWLAALGQGQPGEVDLVPVLTGGSVALTGADGALDPLGPGSSPRIVAAPDETEADAVARVLADAGHALRLARVLGDTAKRGLSLTPPLKVGYTRQSGCAAPGPETAVDPARGLAPCDRLWVTVGNVGGGPVDLSLLYFNADFTVSAIWPRQGLSNRLAPGEAIRAGLQIGGATPALEELMILAVPVDPDAARVDLTRLAEPAATRSMGGRAQAMTDWIDGRLQDDMMTRGFSAKPADLILVRQAVRIRPGDEE